MKSPSARQILLVDADASARTTAARWLMQRGHVVHTAASGADALAYLMETDVDLVITEFAMGRVAGRDWLEFLRAEYGGALLVVTALPRRLVPDECPMLRKPLDLEQLEEFLASSDAARA